MAPSKVSIVRIPSAQLAPVACVLARSSRSSEPKPVIVPAKARASLSTAVAFWPKASAWPLPTAACRVIVEFVSIRSVPVP